MNVYRFSSDYICFKCKDYQHSLIYLKEIAMNSCTMLRAEAGSDCCGDRVAYANLLLPIVKCICSVGYVEYI